MRVKIIRLYALSFLALFAGITLILFDQSNWLIVPSLTAAFAAFGAIVYVWNEHINAAISNSSKVLSRPSPVSQKRFLQDPDIINKDLADAAYKFKISAELITQLTQRDQQDPALLLGANDPIAVALQGMKKEMHQILAGDEKREWVALGLANFSEILRDKTDLPNYTSRIIRELVKYMKLNQGGFFIEFEEEGEKGKKYLELTGCYAYGRKKFVENRIHPGQGLLGQMMLEKEIIYLTDIPPDYVKITSGLGEATPRNIVVAPLIFNEIFCGAVELASFELLEPHHFEFLKKVCVDIASEIVSLKNVDHTQKLLEASNRLTLELQVREEEMQQNLQELAATQEEMKIREKEFERLSLVANNTDNAVIITNTSGLVEYVNHGFVKMTGFNREEIIGKKPGHLLQGEDSDAETIKRVSERLSRREPVYEEILNYNKAKEPYWVSMAINPVFDNAGELSNFISVQANITETKISSLDYRYKLDAIGRSNAIIEFDTNGMILDANANFLRLTEYSIDELVGRHHSLLVPEDELSKSSYTAFWNRLAQGEFITDDFARKTKSGRTLWLRSSYNPILDLQGRTKRIVKFAVDISEERRLQRVAEKKQKELNGYLDGINNTIASATFGNTGIFMEANEIFLKVMGFTKGELAGKDFNYLMGDDPAVNMIWISLCLGKFFSGEFKMKNKAGKELWFNGTFNPIKVESEAPEKIMMFAQFTTQEKEKLSDLTILVNALKSTLPVMEFNPDFQCKTANEKMLKIFGLNRLSLRTKSILDFLDPLYREVWETKIAQITSKDFSEIILPLLINNEIIHCEVSLSVIRNEGSISKIIMIIAKGVNNSVPVLIS